MVSFLNEFIIDYPYKCNAEKIILLMCTIDNAQLVGIYFSELGFKLN